LRFEPKASPFIAWSVQREAGCQFGFFEARFWNS